jgi:hypothetical protein
MSHWSFWDWIAYGCLGISAFGWALGAIPREHPHMFDSWPAFFASPKWSFVPAAFFVLGSAILMMRLLIVPAPKPVDLLQSSSPIAFIERSELKMHSYGDDRTPTAISNTNVWRWFYLRSIFGIVNVATGEKKETVQPTLFICFDRPTKVGTLNVSSGDFKLPRHEVKEFNNRFAVISFYEDLPTGSFTVETY